MKTKSSAIGAVLLLAVVGTLAFVQFGIGGTAERENASKAMRMASVPDGRLTPVIPGPAVTPEKSDEDRSSMRPVGSPALQPTIKDAGPSTPAFTTEDVIKYHDAMHTYGAGQYGIEGYPSTTPVNILKIEFLTEQQLRARMPSYRSGLPDDTLLCFVQCSGSFTVTGPPGVKPMAASYAMEVFDAHTGNGMMYGAGPAPKQ